MVMKMRTKPMYLPRARDYYSLQPAGKVGRGSAKCVPKQRDVAPLDVLPRLDLPDAGLHIVRERIPLRLSAGPASCG
jgi:hypothetical protein